MRRAPTVVGWFDTAGGRHLLVHHAGWTSVAPADGRRIAARLDELLTSAGKHG